MHSSYCKGGNMIVIEKLHAVHRHLPNFCQNSVWFLYELAMYTSLWTPLRCGSMYSALHINSLLYAILACMLIIPINSLWKVLLCHRYYQSVVLVEANHWSQVFPSPDQMWLSVNIFRPWLLPSHNHVDHKFHFCSISDLPQEKRFLPHDIESRKCFLVQGLQL